MDDGVAQCYFRVVEGGFIVHRAHNVLEFQWLGLDAHQVKMCAVDRAGNFGAWETYTYSVLPNTSADWVRYISASGNDTTGDGSVGNPWATATKASTEFVAAVGANQVGAVIVEDDDTWAHTATLLNTGDSIRRLLRFVRRGNGSTRPKFTFSNGITAFTVGKRGAVHVDGIDLEGAHTTDVGAAFNLLRAGGVAADQSPWDLMVVDSEVTNFGMVCYCNPNFGGGPTHADRDEGCFDFIAFQDCGFEGTRSYHWYGFFLANEVLARNVEFRVQGGGFPSGIVRIWALGRMYWEGCTTPGVSAGVRLMVNNNTPEGGFRNATFVNCTHVGIAIGADPGATGSHYFGDVRLVGCRAESNPHLQIRADDAGSNGINLARLDMIACQTMNGSMVTAPGSAATPHTYSKIRVRDSIATLRGASFAYLPAAASRVADDCYTFTGNTKISGIGNDAPLFFDCGVGITLSDFASKLEQCDYNNTVKGDANTHNWIYASGTNSLATWRTNQGHDLNSKQTWNSTGNVVNDGIAVRADGDIHLLSASGPIYQNGFPRPVGVGVTADGYLRSSGDASPYDYGASTLPDDPELPAPATSTRRRRGAGLRGLRPQVGL